MEERHAKWIDPIYAALDTRQYKVAIRCCDHKKIVHFPLVQALKAHCLERSGRIDEAWELVTALLRTIPTESRVLHIVSIVARSVGKTEALIPCYTRAVSENPGDEELGRDLFFAHGRNFNWKAQQKVAMQLYKRFERDQYVHWAALCMSCQVDLENGSTTLLHLGVRMVEKTLLTTPVAEINSEAIVLLIDLHVKLKQYEQALEVFKTYGKTNTSSKDFKPRAMEGAMGYDEHINLGPLTFIDQKMLEMKLLGYLEKWETIVKIATTLLQNMSDDWSIWCTLLEASTAMAKRDESDAPVRECSGVIQDLKECEMQKKGGVHRGPFLAELHFAVMHLNEKHGYGEDASTLLSYICAYVERFKSKSCCFTDIKKYLTFFLDSKQNEKRLECITFFKDVLATQMVPEESPDNAKNVTDAVRWQIIGMQILRYLGYYAAQSNEDLLAVRETVLDMYTKSLWVNATAPVGQRQVQHGDDLLLLLSHLLLDAIQKTSSFSISEKRGLLVQACMLLEYGLANSPYNFQMKFVLVYCYSALGSAHAAALRYAELGIKQIQLDSLSYLILDTHLMAAQVTESKQLCTALIDLHAHGALDAPESVLRAYRLNVLSKAKEITVFQKTKMQRSYQLASCRAELGNILLLENSSSLTTVCAFLKTQKEATGAPQKNNMDIYQFDESELDKMSFNHDRDIIVSWDAPSVIKPSSYMWSAENEDLAVVDKSANAHMAQQWLRLKDVVSNLLYCTLIVPDGSTFDKENIRLEDIVKDLRRVTNTSAAMMVMWDVMTYTTSTFSTIFAITTNDATEAEDGWKAAAVALHTLMDCIQTLLVEMQSVIKSQDGFLSSHAISVLSMLCCQTGHWTMLLLAAFTKVVPRSKKKSSNSSESKAQCQHAIRDTISLLLHLFVQVDAKLERQPFLEAHTMTTWMSAPSVALLWCMNDEQTSLQNLVFENIHTSQQTIRTQLHSLLADKVQFLRSLK